MEGIGALPKHWLLRALDLETSRADAAQVKRETLQAFQEALQEAWTATADAVEVRNRLDAYLVRLRKIRPGDAPLNTALDRMAMALGLGREAALAEVEAVLGEEDAAAEALIANAEGLFRPGSRVLTLGYSELLAKLLTRYGDRLEGVTVCEGRPRSEGARLAAEVGAQAIPVRLVTEAQLELMAPECDVAVAAVERVLPDGSAVAPVGTAVLARLCAAHDVPFYGVAEHGRWVPEGDALAHFGRERRPPAEVLPQPPQGVQVVNIAYDRTPPELIAGYLTESGIVTPQQEVSLQQVA